MVRREVDALGDMRALQIEHNRSNPLDGRQKLSKTQFPASTPSEPFPQSGGIGAGGRMKKQSKKDREDERLAAEVAKLEGKGKISAAKIGKETQQLHKHLHQAMEGSGATPSMGLSQFRGGAREVGAGFADYLRKSRGDEFLKEMMKGMRPAIRSGRPEFAGGAGTGQYEGKGKKGTKKAEISKAQLVREAMMEHPNLTAHRRDEEVNAMREQMDAGTHPVIRSGADVMAMREPTFALLAMKKSKAADSGMGDSCSGMGKQKRAPTARGLMVKKLMKEKGMSLGEASKYIKEHSLM